MFPDELVKINEGVAGFNVILPPLTVALSKLEPVRFQPPIVPEVAVTSPLFTVNAPLLEDRFPEKVPLAPVITPVNVPSPVIVNFVSPALYDNKDVPPAPNISNGLPLPRSSTRFPVGAPTVIV